MQFLLALFIRPYWILIALFAAYVAGAFSANHGPIDPVYLELGR